MRSLTATDKAARVPGPGGTCVCCCRRPAAPGWATCTPCFFRPQRWRVPCSCSPDTADTNPTVEENCP